MSILPENETRFVWTVVIILAFLGIASAIRRIWSSNALFRQALRPANPGFDSGFSEHALLTLLHIMNLSGSHSGLDLLSTLMQSSPGFVIRDPPQCSYIRLVKKAAANRSMTSRPTPIVKFAKSRMACAGIVPGIGTFCARLFQSFENLDRHVRIKLLQNHSQGCTHDACSPQTTSVSGTSGKIALVIID